MRSALQRLLQRPSSLEILRYLVGKPAPDSNARHARTRRYYCQNLAFDPPQTHYLTKRIPAPSAKRKPYWLKSFTPNPDSNITASKIPPEETLASGIAKISYIPGTPPEDLQLDYGPWDERYWTREQIECEADLSAKSGPRLTDHPVYSTDVRLWACLLNYSRRIHGPEAVGVYWNAVLNGAFALPVSGPFTDFVWSTFLSFGFQDKEVLESIINYADKLRATTGKSWRWLYQNTIQHMLLSGRGNEAGHWHKLIIENHPPTPTSVCQLYRIVCHSAGDMDALTHIYYKNNLRNAYRHIVPILVKNEDFFAAYKWHFYLVNHGDLPRGPRDIMPLIQFMALYYPPRARRLTESLVSSGAAFARNLSAEQSNLSILSSEIINTIHGNTLGIKPKEYNDTLGARWFATRWISLDLAMAAIHALGVREIGPLSLQAIALRDTSAEVVMHHISQLEGLGISVGTSMFSRAVKHFALEKQQEHLDGLLKSDQHPDTLEDEALQDSLLEFYARSKDRLQYRRTEAIKKIRWTGRFTEVDPGYLIARDIGTNADSSQILGGLRKMQASGVQIMPETISFLLSRVLGQRRRGRRASETQTKRQLDDVSLAITILRGIIESGDYVPPQFWREIIRRLGMAGRFQELSDLCIYLAAWYGPSNHSAVANPTKTQRASHRYRVPRALPTSHPLHPLKILFGGKFQAAAVEWGFMEGLKSHRIRHSGARLSHHKLTPVTRGITLILKLQEYGVSISLEALRRSLWNRLIIYYGPGKSSRLHNRGDIAHSPLALSNVYQQIRGVVGPEIFTPPRLILIERKATKRLRRRGIRFQKQGKTRDPSLSYQ